MFLELLILSPIYILLPPIFFIISITLFLAVIGQSLGVRRLYIDFLLKVFEVVIVSKEKNTTKKQTLSFCSMLIIRKRRRITREPKMDSLLEKKFRTQTLLKKVALTSE